MTAMHKTPAVGSVVYHQDVPYIPGVVTGLDAKPGLIEYRVSWSNGNKVRCPIDYLRVYTAQQLLQILEVAFDHGAVITPDGVDS